MIGYRRFEGLEAATLLAQLYRSARLFVNFFQPSFKLIVKRDGARVHKTYSAPATPHQRLAADARTSDEVRACLQETFASLDPVALLRDISDAGAVCGAYRCRACREHRRDCAADRSFPGELENRLEGGRRSSDRSANRQSKTRPSPSGPARSSDAGFAQMV